MALASDLQVAHHWVAINTCKQCLTDQPFSLQCHLKHCDNCIEDAHACMPMGCAPAFRLNDATGTCEQVGRMGELLSAMKPCELFLDAPIHDRLLPFL